MRRNLIDLSYPPHRNTRNDHPGYSQTMTPHRAQLVPTPITDKNGKQTTVHKKPANKAATNKALPSPAPVSTPTQQDRQVARRKALITAIAKVSNHYDSTSDTDIDQDSMLDLLTTHKDPVGLADIIITRNLTDPTQITALYDTMNQNTAAINDGVL